MSAEPKPEENSAFQKVLDEQKMEDLAEKKKFWGRAMIAIPYNFVLLKLASSYVPKMARSITSNVKTSSKSMVFLRSMGLVF